VLQVGSFRDLSEADRQKATLALIGLEADIQTVSIDGEETWHRVRLGPYQSLDALNEARGRLYENHIDTIVYKLKD
jgi:cell division protein FtsN